jgi:hypothetical protein
VETRQGLNKRIYYTFVGANFDLPVDDKNVFTTMIGVQKFTGDNLRIHLRGSYIHVLKRNWGLSAQVRTRYFHSTDPNEFDYFSPRDYVEILPILQIRRFDKRGWMYQIAGGYGAQRATGSGWHKSRYADVRVESPAAFHKVDFFAEFQYSNTSVTGGLKYYYILGRTGLTFAF